MAGNPKDDMYRVIQGFDRFEKEIRQETEESVKEAIDIIFQKSQELVPVATGALKGSGKAEVKREQLAKRSRVRGTIEYGGPSSVTGKNNPDGIVRYAVAVHELNTPFLRMAVDASINEINSKIRQRFQKVSRKGKRGA